MADGATIGVRAKTRRKLIADLWCGAGGTITGASRAAKKMGMELDVVSVNHWPTAIATHSQNYPLARHHCADLESARPIELVPEGRLDTLIASPTCTFHSRARGGKPVTDQQRMDPWHVVRWCTELRVKRVLIENVPEFMDWGPCSLVTGRPIASRKGEYFRAWCDALRAIGFRIDYRVLCCADYGDATTRKRFFLIGCSDGKPLRWPTPSHARKPTTDLFGQRLRWRGASEIIDWNLPSKSIFTRKKPLAPNTLRRILAGAVRYGWPQPYLDALTALLQGNTPVLDVSSGAVDPMLITFRGTQPEQLNCSSLPVSEPIPTVSAGGIHVHVGMVMATATASGGAAREVSEPVPTIVGGGNGASPHFITPLLMGTSGNSLAKPTDHPAPTITTGGAGNVDHPGNARPQLIEPVLAPYYGGGSGLTSQPVTLPVPAVTTKARFGLAEPVVMRTDQTGSGATGVRSSDDPLHTLVSKANVGLAQPFLVPNFSENGNQRPRTHDVQSPLPAVTATGHIQLATPAMDGYRIDILYRMLHWRELAGATSFDDRGEKYHFSGNSTEITKQIGNAVPCRMAEALFGALMEDA